MPRRFITLALIAFLALALDACGRRSNLEKPEGATYPRDYPAGYTVPATDDDNKKNK